jgi:predicted nucleic acid-binding protein
VRLVLDASVAVAAVRPREPSHAAALGRVSRALRGADEITVPILFSIEVVAALARAGEPLPTIRSYVDALLAAAVRVAPLGPRSARRARETAMRWQLRGADAVYVSLSIAGGLPLCTLDDDLARRCAAACAVIGP